MWFTFFDKAAGQSGLFCVEKADTVHAELRQETAALVCDNSASMRQMCTCIIRKLNVNEIFWMSV
jgi:hypothetical protein